MQCHDTPQMTSPQFSSAAVLPPEPRFPQHPLGRGLVVAAPKSGRPIPHLVLSRAGTACSGLLLLSKHLQQNPSRSVLLPRCRSVGTKAAPSLGWVLLDEAACGIKQSVNFTARVRV